MNTEYAGTCYVGVVGPEIEYVECRDSIMMMDLGPGDAMRFVRATKGYEARQTILDEFMASDHAFCLFLDQDQVFPRDTLTRLRSHKLPYVSGYYLRRSLDRFFPIWQEPGEEFPYQPWMNDPEPGRLHELGASGWGCILVHRDVVTAMRPILKGEREILEDDMDVWPYDLREVLHGREQLRPLRGSKADIIGSDIRFPFYARAAGFKLYGDPDVRCGHMLHMPLHPDHYSQAPAEYRANMKAAAEAGVDTARARVRQALEGLK